MATQATATAKGVRIHITGIVQGVGFRPFVYGLARRYGLTGWVCNTSAGVDIEADGPADALAAFAAALRDELPPLARIDSLSAAPRPADGFTAFDIRASRAEPGAFQPISPDVAVCDDCRRELFDPADRRHRYPFINCTNCGPRFTIIRDIPYDRPLTTMAGFPLCPACAAEYADPLDRRFHAQPVACPVCGPRLWLERPGEAGEQATGEDALQATRALLREGGIVAVKGLGGFHLACDATNAAAVAELRRRKLRVGKPFAVMLPDLAAARRACVLSPAEEALLLSRARPIVVARRRADSTIAAAVAPGQSTIGIMLPYTPLHHLLLERAPDFPEALVMTSGNLSEEPIAHSNEAARERLAGLANALLLHDRAIETRCDDSVMRVVEEGETTDYTDFTDFSEERRGSGAVIGTESRSHALPLRRSRGYAPYPVRLPWSGPSLLATGAELKNTFCLTRDDYAFLSHHIGDLENYETLLAFEDGVAHLERLFRVRPEAIAYDLHPDYLSTRYALERAARQGLPAVGVQHHHAHVAAGMAEHGLPRDAAVIGVTFDGTGYGDDGAIWGGEFLVAGYGGYRRAAHLRYVPLPGGDRAVREPWRVALAWLEAAALPWDDDLPPVAHARALSAPDRLTALQHQLGNGLNSPPTSSMGRLFDAVAALAGVRQTVSYEAQAAIEFEAAADAGETCAYEFDYHWQADTAQAVGHNMAQAIIPPASNGRREMSSRTTPETTLGYAKKADGMAALQIDPAPVFAALLADQRAGLSLGRRAARFHNGVALMTRDVCRRLRHAHALNDVVLSGGVWQNVTLLRRALALLRADGFTVYTHRLVPPNDGGLALGQAVVASCQLSVGSPTTN